MKRLIILFGILLSVGTVYAQVVNRTANRISGTGTAPTSCTYSASSNPVVSYGGTLYLCSSGGTYVVVGGGGGGMVYPAGTGIAAVTGGTAWGSTYNASNLIPANFVSTLNQNTSGTAANLSGTPALPNGVSATTQAAADNTTKIATDAFVLANAASVPTIDTPPASPSPYNDEFNATTLNSIWTVQTNTADVVSVGTKIPGSLYAYFNGTSHAYVISQSFSPSGDVDITFCLTNTAAVNYSGSELIIGDSISETPSNGIIYQWGVNAGQKELIVTHFISGSKTNDSIIAPGTQYFDPTKVYLHLQRVSNVWSAWYSFTGDTWVEQVASIGSGFNPTLADMMLVADTSSYTSSPWASSFDWLRVNWLTLP